MTSPPNRLGMYSDVQAILDEAFTHGGGEFELESHGQAVHWRQRAYKFRKLYAALHASSKYDLLTLPTIEGNVVTIRKVEQKGIFRPAGPRIEDDLQAQADELARKLSGNAI